MTSVIRVFSNPTEGARFDRGSAYASDDDPVIVSALTIQKHLVSQKAKQSAERRLSKRFIPALSHRRRDISARGLMFFR